MKNTEVSDDRRSIKNKSVLFLFYAKPARMIINKIRNFSKLSSRERSLFLEARLILGMMQVSIRTISFKRLTCSLKQQQSDTEITPLNHRELEIAITIGRAINSAANNTPWESACLVQSLTAQLMLKKRGIPGVFFLGVMKNIDSSENLCAHAWSQCGDMIITGHNIHKDFTALSLFRWGRP